MGRPLNFRQYESRNFRELFIHTQSGRHTITRQKGTRSYYASSQGNTVFRLVNTDDIGSNQAYMKAYDSAGNTYLVTKLTRHLAVVHQYQRNGTEVWQFANPFSYPNGQEVKWNRYANAVANETVAIENDD